MQIIKITDGYAVKFPIALKDAFRTAFPSAKWNASAKQWEVGPRSGTRLQTWVDEATETAHRFEAQDERDFTAKELEKVRLAIKLQIERCGELEALRAETAESRRLLAAGQTELAQASEARQEAEAGLAAERKAVTDLLESVIDMNVVRNAFHVMSANMIPGDRNRKARFEAEREKVKAQRDCLAAAGFACSAINQLAGANVNRPDRDHPRNILEQDWYRIWELEESDG